MPATTKTLIAICLLFGACESGTSAKKNIQEKLTAHKQFVKSLSFTGIIREKKYCEECAVNKYQIFIHLYEITPPIAPDQRSFPPYYQFAGDSLLNISVPQNLFEYEQEELIVEKKTASNFMMVSNLNFQLLSDQQDEWLPTE